MSLYENLVNFIRFLSNTNLIIAAIIPRPCDLKENRVKSFNKELELLCKRRKLTFLHRYRIFLHNNCPIRSYFAIRDNGLHLNTEGVHKLKLFSFEIRIEIVFTIRIFGFLKTQHCVWFLYDLKMIKLLG